MKKLVTIAAVAVCFSASLFAFKTVKNDRVSDLLMQNIEALAGPEVISNGGITIIFDYKNKWGGLVAGCKAKENHTCTVKTVDFPDINL